MPKHQNNGFCPRCQLFLESAHPDLRAWFEPEQEADPELHISCSVRGSRDQQEALERGASKASFGKSPHNYETSWAIDLFFIVKGSASWVFSRYKALAANKPDYILWGADWNDNGRTDDEKFKDSPHFEIKDWKTMEPDYPNGTA